MKHGILLILAFCICQAGATESTRRTDGTLLIDGQPWFPFGYYHVSWIGDRYGAARTADLVNIADHGGNMMHPSLASDNPGLATFFSTASTRGVHFVPEIYWPSRATEIPLLKGNAAVAGWNIGDDVNWPPTSPAYTPAALLARHQEVKALDATRLTYAAGLADGYDIAAYANMVDVFGLETYPIGNVADANALEINHTWCAITRTAFAGSTTSWILLPQTFAWPGERFPTTGEMRNLIYGGLIEGAKGVVGYTFYDDGGVLPTLNPGLWSELGLIASEVNTLRAVFTDATLSRPATGAANAWCGLWRTANASYVVVVNTSNGTAGSGGTARSVSIALPAGSGTTATPVFAGRPSGLTISAGRLVGSVAPRDVHVYRIDDPVGANTAPTISNVANQTTLEDTPLSGITITVGDAETAASSLTLTATSSNTTLVPNSNLVLGGTGANRTLRVTPPANQNGTTTITLTVSDGSLTTTTSFVLTVTAVNDAPTISGIANQTTSIGVATAALAFTVGDVETGAASLTVSGSSSNTTLLPNANIVFGGSGANRTVTLTPAAGQTGTATITLTVNDGTASTPATFTLTVSAATGVPTSPSDRSCGFGIATLFLLTLSLVSLRHQRRS